jgi:hypothetical protein
LIEQAVVNADSDEDTIDEQAGGISTGALITPEIEVTRPD